MHRALSTLARGNPLPDAVSLAAALRQEGLSAPAAAPWRRKLRPNLRPARRTRSWPRSWPRRSPGRPASGSWRTSPSRAPSAGASWTAWPSTANDWWILDFKSSRPAAGEDWDAFIARETEKYRPQLLAYREMAAKAKGIEPPEDIRVGIYFTACQQVVEV